MSKPYIVIVDDEPQVLSAINRDLRNHYQGDYRIVRAGSGADALETIKQLKQRNEPVALFLSDQRMPVMSGTEFLEQAMAFYPNARKVLLTAYADTEAAIASINTIGLDHYLMKPWDPPEQNLYPVLDDLLSEWHRQVPVPYDGIRVAGTLWSAASHNIKDFLSRNRIPYQWLDIEKDAEAQKLVDATLSDKRQLPVLFLPGGEVIINPDYKTLADKVGLQTQAKAPFYDLIIIGAGPSGLAAAVYGASEGLHTLAVEKEATGGQAGQSSRIENYLGFPKGLSGADLASRATIQASRLGAEILTAQEVVGVRVEEPYKIVTLGDGSELSCKALMIATGVSVRQLNIPGLEKISGAGVYYGAAMTEAAHYKDQHVFVIGGANSAGQGAMFFSRYAGKVTMLVRGSSLSKSMSQYLIDQIDGTSNIEVITRMEVIEAHGEQKLEAITIRNADNQETQKVPAAAIFIFIGATAHTDFVGDLVERNSAGFILTGPDLIKNGKLPNTWLLNREPLLYETNIPGVFAVGDVRHGSVKRVASAVGEGAVCVALVHQYLRTV